MAEKKYEFTSQKSRSGEGTGGEDGLTEEGAPITEYISGNVSGKIRQKFVWTNCPQKRPMDFTSGFISGVTIDGQKNAMKECLGARRTARNKYVDRNDSVDAAT